MATRGSSNHPHLRVVVQDACSEEPELVVRLRSLTRSPIPRAAALAQLGLLAYSVDPRETTEALLQLLDHDGPLPDRSGS